MSIILQALSRLLDVVSAIGFVFPGSELGVSLYSPLVRCPNLPGAQVNL